MISSRPRAAPVTFGWFTRSNRIGSYKKCSFAGMSGVQISGEQLWGVVAAVGSPPYTSYLYSIDGTGNGLVGAALYPLSGNGGAANTIGTVETADPLYTECAVQTRFRYRRASLTYVPNQGTNVDNIQVVVGWMPSPAASAANYSTPSQVESCELSVTTPVWAETTLDVANALPQDRLFVLDESALSSVGSGSVDYVPGVFLVNVQQTGISAAAQLGRLFLRYEIELYFKRPYPAGLGLASPLAKRLTKFAEDSTRDERKVPSEVIPGQAKVSSGVEESYNEGFGKANPSLSTSSSPSMFAEARPQQARPDGQGWYSV